MARATLLDERPEEEHVDDVTQEDEAQPVEQLAEQPQEEPEALSLPATRSSIF